MSKTEVLARPLSYSSIIKSSRLRTVRISESDSLPSIVSMPHVVQLDRINKVHLLFHDWPTGLNLPALRHVTLTNNLVALKNFSSFSSNIRSIQIILHPHNYAELCVEQLVIANVVPTLVHFGTRFRSKGGLPSDESVNPEIWANPTLIDSAYDLARRIIGGEDDDDLETLVSSVNDYRASIKELHCRILCIISHMKPLIVIEEGGCGLNVWL